MKRITTWICGVLLACHGSAWALDVVTINGVRMEAGAVLARLKDAGDVRLRAFSVPDAEVEHRSKLVPGLLALRKNAGGGLRALSQEAKAEALLKWIEELKATGQFEYVEPSYIYDTTAVPNDARFFDGTLWGLYNFGQAGGVPGADISATNAWDFSIGSTNVIVAVIDTGVRYTHRDLNAQMWRNPGEIPGNGVDDDNDGYVDNEFGIDAFENDGDPLDDDGHGTHVAGTIGAAANDGNPHVGVAWRVQLMALRAGSGSGLPGTAIVRCIEFAGDRGARVINASFGGFGFSQAQFDAISNLRTRGVLFVAAAGNDNNDNDLRPAYPASYRLDNIISVAAMDRRDLLANFSNYGHTTVHLGAPGVEIFSTYNRSDTDYNILQGTSMAAPHVAGVAALVAAYLPGAGYSEIRTRILDGVTLVPTLASRTITGGRVNAFRALTRGVDGVLEFSITPASDSLLTIGERVTISLNLSDGPVVTNATVSLSGTVTNLSLRFDSGTNSATAGTYTNTLAVPSVPGVYPFTLTASAPGKTNLSAQIRYEAVNRPANDRFINAFKVPPQASFTQVTSNRLATIEGEAEERLRHGGVAGASSSIWYAWSLPQRTPVIIDTAGSTFDTVIGVYSGTSLETLEEVAQADDAGARKDAWVKFVAEPNVSYKIAIAGAPPSQEGTVQVRFEINGEPDTVAPIVQITSPVSGLTVRDRKINIQGIAFDPQPNASGIQEAGVQYTVSTSQIPNPNQLPRSAEGTTNWLAPVDLADGINFITVWAFDNAENRSREQQIAIIYRLPLMANDLFIDALTLSPGQNSLVVNTENATKEFGEPPHGGNAGGKSVWFKFTPAQSGVLLLNTRGSVNTANNFPLDTVMSVYVSTNLTAPKVTTLDQLAGNDDVAGAGNFSEITLTVEPGRTYYIAVDGYDAASGNVHLNHAFNPVPVFQVTMLPSAGNGTVTPRSGPFPANATLSVVARPAAGSQFEYFELNGAQSRQNPLTFVVSADSTVRAVFGARAFSEDFEGGGAFRLPFALTNWVVSLDPASPGNHVLQSAGNGLNRITNTAAVVVRTEAGTGGFEYGTSTELNYDRLEFFMTPMEAGQPTNTVFLGSWSGESRGRYEFSLPGGLVRLEWRYVKDRAITAGRDVVFIDNIDLPVAAGVSALSVQGQTTTVNVRGAAGQYFLIETSTDLKTWTDAGTARASENGQVELVEPAKGPRKFFRFTPISPGAP